MTALCSSVGYMINVLSWTSSWFMVGLASERLILVAFPIKGKQWTSKKKAICWVLSQVIVSLIVFCDLWLIDFSKDDCSYKKSFTWYSRGGRQMFFIISYNAFPLILICVCYTSLVILVKLKRRKMKQQNANVNKADDRLTAMALLVCLAFLLLFIPSMIYVALTVRLGWYKNRTPLINLVDASVMLLKQFNFSINFFLCLLSNNRFRSEMRKMLPFRNSVQPGQ